MFQRLKRFYQLSKKDPKALEVLEQLTPEQMAAIPDVGDGKAEFFGEGSEEEFKQQELADKGMDKWYNRLKNL